MAGTRPLLRWISLMMLAVGPFLLWSQFRSSDKPGWQEAVTGTVVALVGMVPKGLVLSTTVAFLLAVITLARWQTLVQELSSVEALARVDVVCLDKTGTLTHGDIVFDRMDLLGGASETDAREALALLAAGPDANATTAALAAEFVPSEGWRRTGAIAFSSARKWSAVTAEEHGMWALGAPEMVLPRPSGQTQAEGRRVMANIERAASLFLVKNVYSLVLAVIAGVTLTAYPFAPIQLTLISTLTIGVPGFVLALGPNRRRYLPGFLRRVLRFAVPAGVAAGTAAYAGYRVTRLLNPATGVSGGRTTATLAVLVIALWTLVVLARPLAGWKLALVAVMAAAVMVIVAVPALGTSVFLLAPAPLPVLVAAAVGATGGALVEVSYRAVALVARAGSGARPSIRR